MYSFVSILVMLVSILLVLIVLVQNSKGGGLASNFSASNQIMGVRKTTDFLEKATWSLATILLVLSFISVMVLPRETMGVHSELDDKVKNIQIPQQQTPAFPAPESDKKTNGDAE
ncbi:MAG: preprotein translocase subunit SecG [Breznakibacter sp.]